MSILLAAAMVITCAPQMSISALAANVSETGSAEIVQEKDASLDEKTPNANGNVDVSESSDGEKEDSGSGQPDGGEEGGSSALPDFEREPVPDETDSENTGGGHDGELFPGDNEPDLNGEDNEPVEQGGDIYCDRCCGRKPG